MEGDKYLMDSRLPFEKVIFFREGEFIGGQSDWWQFSEPNPTGHAFLALVRVIDAETGTYMPTFAGATHPTRIGGIGIAVAGKKYLYKMWGFSLEDASDDSTFEETSSKTADDFQMSTSGELYTIHSTTINTARPGQTITINHNLGYAPIVKCWLRQEDDIIFQKDSNFNTYIDITATETQVIVRNTSTEYTDDVIVRIYTNAAE